MGGSDSGKVSHFRLLEGRWRKERERGEKGGMAFTVSASVAVITSGVWRTSTNWNPLFPHISYAIMCQKRAALFFIPTDTGRERKTGRGRGRRERQGKDLISSWEHANGR